MNSEPATITVSEPVPAMLTGQRATTVHLVVPEVRDAYGFVRALCGKHPGRRTAGWNFGSGLIATCRQCIKRRGGR